MDRKDLIKSCRYYRGETENPFRSGDKSMFWDYERKWVELSIDGIAHGENSASSQTLGEMLDDYLTAGLAQFEMQDDTPATLKALLFNRYCYWNSGSMLECVPGFKDFYKTRYY